MFFYSAKQPLVGLAVFEARHVSASPNNIASMRRLAVSSSVSASARNRLAVCRRFHEYIPQ